MLREYKWAVCLLLHSIYSLFYIITVFDGIRSYHGPGHEGGGAAALVKFNFDLLPQWLIIRKRLGDTARATASTSHKGGRGQ